MADISRNTYDESKNYKQVVFQQGQEIADNELNEQAIIQLAEVTEAARNAAQVGRATVTDSGDLQAPGGPYTLRRARYGLAAGDDWLVDVQAGAVRIRQGALYVDGFRIVLPETITPTLDPVLGVSESTYGLIVLQVVMAEVGAGDDPNIATPQLGETTVRRKLTWSILHVKHGTSWRDAWASLGVLSGGDLLGGDTARVVLARYYRDGSYEVLQNGELVCMVQRVPAYDFLKHQVFMKTFRQRSNAGIEEGDAGEAAAGLGTVDVDGVCAWFCDENMLIIGDGLGTTHAWQQSSHGGWMMRNPTTPDHNAFHPFFEGGIGPGIRILSGEALGYFDVAVEASTIPARTDAQLGPEEVVLSVADASIINGLNTEQAVRIQQLGVMSLRDVAKCTSPMIIAVRRGRDLIFRNGDVVRGRRGTHNGAFFDLGNEPGEWRAVISREADDCDASSEQALQRVLDFMTHAKGAGQAVTDGETRLISVLVKAGQFRINGRKVYGNSTTDPVAFRLKGTSRLTSGVVVRAADAGAPDGDHFRLQGRSVVIEDLDFGQLSEDGVNPLGWVLVAEAMEVIIRRCRFTAPVRIIAQSSLVEDCVFETPSGLDNDLINGVLHTGYPVTEVASCLSLVPSTLTETSRGTHVVKGCSFNLKTALQVVSAAVRVAPVAYSTIRFERCIFDHGDKFSAPSPDSVSPASIDVTTAYGEVVIEECRFLGHRGQAKAGEELVIPGFPFSPSYAGIPMQTQMTGEDAGCAYVSMVRGRASTSRTRIIGCYFDLTRVSQFGGPTSRFAAWAAVVCTRRSDLSGVNAFHNIAFEDNTLDMGQAAGPGWGGTGNGPWVSGFWMAPMWVAPVSNFLVSNISVRRNRFELASSVSGADHGWRSIFAPDQTTWVNDPGQYRMMDTSACVLIELKNGTDAAGVTVSNRVAWGVFVEDNTLQYSKAHADYSVTCAANTYPYTQWVGIAVTTGCVLNMVTAPVGAPDGTEKGPQVPRICRNTVAAYKVTKDADPSAMAAIWEEGYMSRVAENDIILGASTVGCAVLGRRQAVQNNRIRSGTGILAVSTHATVSNNDLRDCSTGIVNGVVDFTGGGSGDNFT